MLVEIRQHPLDDAYWASKRPELASIRVPALVCASWSDQGLHTRGSLEGFRHISSTQKWLYTHGRGKWETVYSSEAQALQQRFFDCFLKDIDSGMLDVPRVRLEVRRAYYAQDVRGEADWPVPGTTTLRLYLDATQGVLAETPARHESSVAYSAPRTGGSDERAVFAIRFEHDTEVTGGMRLRLWIAAC